MVSVSNLSRTSKISTDPTHLIGISAWHIIVKSFPGIVVVNSVPKVPETLVGVHVHLGTNNYQKVIGPKQQCNSHISMQLVWASPDVLEYQTQTYGNIFKFVGDHQVVKFISSSEGLLDVHIGRLQKCKIDMFDFSRPLHLGPEFSDNMVTCRIVVVLTRLPYLALGIFVIGCKIKDFLLPSRPAHWERTRSRWLSHWWRPPPPIPSPGWTPSSTHPLTVTLIILSTSFVRSTWPSFTQFASPARPLLSNLMRRKNFLSEYLFRTRFASLEPHAGQCWLSFPTDRARQAAFWGSRELPRCRRRPGLAWERAPQAQPVRCNNKLSGPLTNCYVQ